MGLPTATKYGSNVVKIYHIYLIFMTLSYGFYMGLPTTIKCGTNVGQTYRRHCHMDSTWTNPFQYNMEKIW